MNKKVEEQLRAWGKDKEQVPDFFSKGIDDVLNNLPETATPTNERMVRTKPKKKRLVAKSLVAAAVISFGVIGSGFISPTMAQMLKEVPIIGSIFSNSEDRSLTIIDEQDLASTLNQTVTDQGITLTITETYFGGGRLVIAYTIESEEVELERVVKGRGVPLHYNALIDGEQFSHSTTFEQSVDEGVAKGIIDMSIGLESELSEKPVLDLKVKEIAGVTGSWNFTLPIDLEKTKAATKTFSPMTSATWEDAAFVVEKVEFTPVQSQIIIDRTVPKDDIFDYGFSVYDENGTSLGFHGGSGSSVIDVGNGLVNFKDTILLQGREEVPTGLMIEVYNNHGGPYESSKVKEVNIPLTESELPYTLNYPDGSKLIVTGVEQLEDETVVYYDIEGKLNLQNAFLMLEIENGERLPPIMLEAKRTNLQKLSFSQSFDQSEGPISLFTTIDANEVDTFVFEVKLD